MPATSSQCKVSDLEWLSAFGKVNANDIDEGWLSVTIAKIREEMGNQLAYLGGVKKDKQTDQPNLAERTENVRLVIQLQKSAMELAKMEEKRDARLIKKHKGRSAAEVRGGVQRKILGNTRSSRSAKPAGKAQ
jgi:hypothetical protein